MIYYPIYSTLCMGLILLFYHLVLAGEKIYQINRCYLIFGLLFSVMIPFIPIGQAGSVLNLQSKVEIHPMGSHSLKHEKGEYVEPYSANLEKDDGQQTSVAEWVYALLRWLYGGIVIFLALRLIRHLYRMKLRSMKNQATSFKGYKVILLDEETVPHTFWKTIFVDKRQHESGEIREEVMLHELIHARQNHTVDIFLIEILKVIFWFNPVLYVYKTAIQLNHEFIADDEVISEGVDVADYQTLLLNMRLSKPAHYLSTTFHFKITKKRFRMISQNNSNFRSFLKAVTVIPLFIILGITFGCESTSMKKNENNNKVTLEVMGAHRLKLNNQSIQWADFKSRLSEWPIDPEKTIMDLKVHRDVAMGTVKDIQAVIRDRGIRKINYSAVSSGDSQSGNLRGSNIRNRNILIVSFDDKGGIKVNDKQVQGSSLKSLVKEFVTNNGQKEHLSETPKKAIIAIETEKKTPYEIYTGALDNIMAIYDELRDQASMDKFGKSFESLKPGGSQREQIENLYPKNISIKAPAPT